VKPIRPSRAREILRGVDPAWRYAGEPIGLRDGALLALLGTGLTCEEIASLRADAIQLEQGRLRIYLERDGVEWSATVRKDIVRRVLDWLTETRRWGTGDRVFTGPQGTLSSFAIYKLLERYTRRPRQRKTP
jgi:integrase